MVRDTNTRDEATNSVLEDWPRRTVLKLTGATAGLAALGGGSVIGAGQEEDGGENETETEEDSGEDDGNHFTGDLTDPAFGYPLAADESDDVDVEHVVELYTEEGPGDHENFPQPLDGGGEGDGEVEGEDGEFPFEFAFDPVGIQVTTDDVVKFQDLSGEHTVTSFHDKFGIPQRPIPNRIPDGVPGFSSPPLVDGEAWLYQFPRSGVYDLFCLPHLGFGMVMRVVVTDPDGGGMGEGTVSTPTAGQLPPNAQTVFDAPELDPENVLDAGTVAWADLTIEADGMGTETPTAQAVTVQVREHAELGRILVGPEERTLYMFDQDTQGAETSSCGGDCAEAWPPLTAGGEPVAGDGVTAELTTFERADGGMQVTANGWPLYYFARDVRPGDVNGQGVSDAWWVLRPGGTPVRSGSTA